MGLSSRATAELLIMIFSFSLFVGYHVWLFLLRGRWYKVKPTYHDFFQAGKLARSLWAEACATDEKDAILGVQQARNAMTACTYLATISVALATAGITIIFDDSKIERIRQLAVNDAILRHLEGEPLVPPTVIISLALGSLYASFVCFAQSVRLYVHTGFYIRACTSRFNPGTLTVKEAKKVTIHAGVAFSVGLRLFYFFIPLVMWSVGVTALLISSVIMTALVAYMDHFDMASPELPTEEDEEASQHLTAQHAQHTQHNGPAQHAQHVVAASSSAEQTVLELAATAGRPLEPVELANGDRRHTQQLQQHQQRLPSQHDGAPQHFQHVLQSGASEPAVVVIPQLELGSSAHKSAWHQQLPLTVQATLQAVPQCDGYRVAVAV